MLANFCMQ